MLDGSRKAPQGDNTVGILGPEPTSSAGTFVIGTGVGANGPGVEVTTGGFGIIDMVGATEGLRSPTNSGIHTMPGTMEPTFSGEWPNFPPTPEPANVQPIVLDVEYSDRFPGNRPDRWKGDQG